MSDFDVQKLYYPSPWQQECHALKHDLALGAGSAGPGKTLWLLWDPIVSGAQIEHYRCTGDVPPEWPDRLKRLILENRIKWGESRGYALYMRREMPRLRQAIDRCHRWFKVLDPGADWNEKLARWTFSSGFIYQFGHCADERHTDNYLSNEYTHLCMDEAIEFTERQFEMLSTRVRTTDPVLKLFKRVRLATNPSAGTGGGKSAVGHDRGWVKRLFVDPAPKGRQMIKQRVRTRDGYRDVTRIFIPATLYDNPDPEFVKEYEVNLLSKPAHIRRIYLEGDWNSVEGSYYGEVWSPSIHVCEPFKIPKDWVKWRSMDWGFRSPGCIHWFALRPDDKRIFCFFELTFREKSADWVAKEMVRPFEQRNGLWVANEGSKLVGPADSQLWEMRGGTSTSKADMMAAEGVAWVRADKRSRADNARALYECLADYDEVTTTPGIVFFRNCRKVIETVPAMEADRGNPEELAKSAQDHWVESVQYGIRYGQTLVDGVEYETQTDDVENWDQAQWDYTFV